MEEKQKMLFVFPDMSIGGATSAFVALLKKLDYQANDVDVLFLNDPHKRMEDIPPEVNVLPNAAKIDLLCPSVRLKKVLNYVLTGKAAVALFETIKNKSRPFHHYFQVATNQMLARIHCELCPEVEKQYDVAVAYLEFWPTVFVAEKVRAKKKIAWCHVDYAAARLNPVLDMRYYEKMDRIVCVSEACANNMAHSFPELKERVVWAENYIDEERVLRKSKEKVDVATVFAEYDGFRIVTVARLESYTKGLDRIVRIAKKLKTDGYLFRWFLIGGGVDETNLRKLIVTEQIGDTLFLLGASENPYPYIAQADLFVLASRNEGKPIVVSEAQILATPILATAYPAACSQFSGNEVCIVPNEESELYESIKRVLSGEIVVPRTEYRIHDEKTSLRALHF